MLTKESKSSESIPHYMDFTLKTADDWPEYKERLQIDAARIPAKLNDHIAKAGADGRPIMIRVGSMMGWIRNWNIR